MGYPTAGSESPQVASPARDRQAASRWTVRSAFDRGQFLFLDDEVRGRRRRPVDGLLVLIAALLLVVASLVANDSDLNEQRAVIAARTLLGWFDTGWRILYAAALGYGLLVLLAVLVTRRWQLSRDLLIALAAVLLIGLTIGRAVGGDWPSVTERLWPSVNQYPALRLAAVTAVLAVVGPELTRPARLVAVWLVGLGMRRRVGSGHRLSIQPVGRNRARAGGRWPDPADIRVLRWGSVVSPGDSRTRGSWHRDQRTDDRSSTTSWIRDVRRCRHRGHPTSGHRPGTRCAGHPAAGEHLAEPRLPRGQPGSGAGTTAAGRT